MRKLLLELQYFGTISWYLAMMRHDIVVLESQENFEKSTYRNRCYIASPEGKLRLSIPLMQGRNQRSKYSDIRIDYSQPWQKNHWNSLCSCYRNSPYFEYYEDKLLPLFSKKHELLFDFNKKLLQIMIELLELDLRIEYSLVYQKHPPDDVKDLRSKILPNGNFSVMESTSVVYHQVFQERTGFLHDLCVVDLLFNEGPNSRTRLKSAYLD